MIADCAHPALHEQGSPHNCLPDPPVSPVASLVAALRSEHERNHTWAGHLYPHNRTKCKVCRLIAAHEGGKL